MLVAKNNGRQNNQNLLDLGKNSLLITCLGDLVGLDLTSSLKPPKPERC